MKLFFLKNSEGSLLSVGSQEYVEDAEDDAGQDVSDN